MSASDTYLANILDTLERMSTFLESLARDSNFNPMSMTEVFGYIHAVACSPVRYQRSRTRIFRDITDSFKIKDLSEENTDLHDHVEGLLLVTNLNLRTSEFPTIFYWENKQLHCFDNNNLKSKFPLLREWCKGYMTGALSDKIWRNDEVALSYTHLFKVIAETQVSSVIYTDTLSVNKKLSENEILSVLPKHILKIYNYWTVKESLEIKLNLKGD